MNHLGTTEGGNRPAAIMTGHSPPLPYHCLTIDGFEAGGYKCAAPHAGARAAACRRPFSDYNAPFSAPPSHPSFTPSSIYNIREKKNADSGGFRAWKTPWKSMREVIIDAVVRTFFTPMLLVDALR